MRFYASFYLEGVLIQKEIEAERCFIQGIFTMFKKGKNEFFCINTNDIITINTQSFEKKDEKKPLIVKTLILKSLNFLRRENNK